VVGARSRPAVWPGVGYAAPVAKAASVLARLIREKASAEGRMASAFPGLWFFRSERSKRIPRARANSTYIGVGGGGRKTIRAGGVEVAYDSEHVAVIRGETDYEAIIEARDGQPYVALGLEVPAGLVVRTLLDLVDSGAPEPPAAAVAGWCAPLEPWLAEPLVRLLRCLDDRAERAVLAPLALREIVFRLLASPGAPARWRSGSATPAPRTSAATSSGASASRRRATRRRSSGAARCRRARRRIRPGIRSRGAGRAVRARYIGARRFS
jgi:hypothetical protein